MGIPVLQGRVFAGFDRRDSEPVAVVDEVLARSFFDTPPERPEPREGPHPPSDILSPSLSLLSNPIRSPRPWILALLDIRGKTKEIGMQIQDLARKDCKTFEGGEPPLGQAMLDG